MNISKNYNNQINKNHFSNHSHIATIIIARNEEKTIEKTLSCLLDQILIPYRIIVVNDGSTDKTKEIVSKFHEIEIVNLKKRKENFVARKELANTINAGLELLKNDNKCEFVLKLDADHLLPKNYLSVIVDRMKENPKIAVASGVIEDEYSEEPRGSGRVVRIDFWRKIGLMYPANYGFEGYLLWKAKSMGYEISNYTDLLTQTQRKTGSKYNPKLYYYYGKGLKALGYTGLYALVKVMLFGRKKPKGAIYMLSGFLSKNENLYEPELREFVKKTQFQKILHFEYIKRFFNILGKS